MLPSRHFELLTRYLEDQATPAEIEELAKWMELPECDPVISDLMTQDWAQFNAGDPPLPAERAEAILQTILPARQTGVRKFQWALAAATLLLAVAGYFLLRSGPSAPGTVSSLKILATAKGKQLSFQFSDGTRVWLNAATTIRYPPAFPDSIRLIELTGEAYFEVQPATNRPFIVQTAAQRVQVIGTHFNTNAYPDQPAAVTTLLAGAIRVGNQLVHPGEQAVTDSGRTRILPADTAKAVAWKAMRFDFANADLQEVMRQIARWYDVSIEYEGTPPDTRFGGAFDRNLSLSDALQVLGNSGVRYRIDGKKIVILTNP